MLRAKIKGQGELRQQSNTEARIARVCRRAGSVAYEGVIALLFRRSLCSISSDLPKKRLLAPRDQSKLTTYWSRGIALVTLSSAGSTGVTLRRVPSCSASLNA